MEATEVISHGTRSARARLDDLSWSRARSTWRRRWEVSHDTILLRDPANEPIGLLRADRVEELARSVDGASDELRAACAPWLDGRVELLGYPAVDLAAAGQHLDRDPITGRPWPARHGQLIDYRHDAPGDPKLVWELNRLQELPLLTLAGRLTGDDDLLAGGVERLLRWVENHPPGRGIAWANAFEPGIRALSLAVAFDGLRDQEALTDDRGRGVLLALWQHGQFISRNLSSHSSANNHLVGELVGLLAIGTLAPELAGSPRWRAFALKALAREAELQISPDGTNVEQAFAYGLFTADLLLVASSLALVAGEDLPTPIVDRLRRFADALCALVDVGEPDPASGDDDDGRVLLLDGATKRCASAVAASLAAFLGHRGARRLAGELDVTAALLFGADGIERFNAAAGAEPPDDVVLRDGGIVALRRGGSRLLYDVGPLGYLSIAAHGHADALQVDLSVGEREAITDPGTGSYFGDPPLRRRMRSTRVHGTVTVDSLDQSEQGGPFMWLRHAHARLMGENLAEGWAVGEHDGYQRLDPPVAHRRAVVAFPWGYLVVDRLECAQTRLYEQSWPLAPDLDPMIGGERVRLRARAAGDPERDVLAFHAASTVSFEIVVDRTARHSRRLEASQPTSIVRCVARAAGEVILAALLVPGGAASRIPETALSLEAVGGGVRAHIGVGAWDGHVDLSLSEQLPSVEFVTQA